MAEHDDHVGVLLKLFDDVGIADHTIVIYRSLKAVKLLEQIIKKEIPDVAIEK